MYSKEHCVKPLFIIGKPIDVPICFPMINSFTQFTAKCPYGKSFTVNCPYRQSVSTAKCPHGEGSVRQSVCKAKSPTAKSPRTNSNVLKKITWRAKPVHVKKKQLCNIPRSRNKFDGISHQPFFFHEGLQLKVQNYLLVF